METSEDTSRGRHWTGDAAPGVAWAEPSDAAKRLAFQRTPSRNKVQPGPPCQGLETPVYNERINMPTTNLHAWETCSPGMWKTRPLGRDCSGPAAHLLGWHKQSCGIGLRLQGHPVRPRKPRHNAGKVQRTLPVWPWQPRQWNLLLRHVNHRHERC